MLSERDALRERLQGLAIKWVSDANMHLTLRFLGYVPEADVTALVEGLAAVSREHSAFDLATGPLGAFPSPRSPSVLWVGLSGDLERLNALQGSIEGAVSDLSSHEEKRRFHPHITLARCDLRSVSDKRVVETALASVPVGRVTWTIESFELMRSVLKKGGAEYSVLGRFELKWSSQ